MPVLLLEDPAAHPAGRLLAAGPTEPAQHRAPTRLPRGQWEALRQLVKKGVLHCHGVAESSLFPAMAILSRTETARPAAHVGAFEAPPAWHPWSLRLGYSEASVKAADSCRGAAVRAQGVVPAPQGHGHYALSRHSGVCTPRNVEVAQGGKDWGQAQLRRTYATVMPLAPRCLVSVDFTRISPSCPPTSKAAARSMPPSRRPTRTAAPVPLHSLSSWTLALGGQEGGKEGAAGRTTGPLWAET
uniref:uncharacterized protein LOC120886433 isoform X2 n=1 Tax=Ictidomys tridecemlineatus TaxID=43179 RepID=UPI001A9D56CE|nr:uncharacterized protein LOC120886433 isoform X2 [Ictidomys tridecemlineatus]